MSTAHVSGASAPPPTLLQTIRVRQRISASDSVAALVASMAFGVGARDDHARLASIVDARCGTAAEVRP